jgi:hypothetical protein
LEQNVVIDDGNTLSYIIFLWYAPSNPPLRKSVLLLTSDVRATTLSSDATGLYLMQVRQESGCKAFLLGLTTAIGVNQYGSYQSFKQVTMVVLI